MCNLLDKLVLYLKYKKNMHLINKDYIAVYAFYKESKLYDPVSIYRKGDKIVQEGYKYADKILKKSVIDGIDTAIACTSAINLLYMNKNDKMKPFIKELYRSKLNGAPELILDV